ncbi:MAG: polysaccharide deacetylase family protein [Parcubacteria group bacterium]|nr:polysaccharide deacetylase family protein [Parcubacteria group bacterium]
MKPLREISALFFSTLCFSLAAGAWIGSFSLGLFQLAEAEKNIAAAFAIPATPEDVRVPILVYHSVRPHQTKESNYQEIYDITPELLRKELLYLKENGYAAISFKELADYFDMGASIPGKPVILTFDDGWKNQYEYAFPLLKEFDTTATFFIFTNAVGRGNHLTWEQLREMRDAGISIEAHTKFHPYLKKITDQKELANEIAGSKKILEEELGVSVTSLAYPFGQYDDASMAEAKTADFRTARSLRGGVMQSESERYILRASLATDNFNDFVRILGQ